MKFGIIITFTKFSEKIQLTLDSISAISKKPSDILLVGHLNNDLKNILLRYSGFKINFIESISQNTNELKNIGIKNIDLKKIDFIILMEDGFCLNKNFLKLVENSYKKNRFDVLQVNMKYHSNNSFIKYFYDSEKKAFIQKSLFDKNKMIYVNTNFLIFRKSISQLIHFNELKVVVGEDLELSYKLGINNVRVFFDPKIFVNFFIKKTFFITFCFFIFNKKRLSTSIYSKLFNPQYFYNLNNLTKYKNFTFEKLRKINFIKLIKKENTNTQFYLHAKYFIFELSQYFLGFKLKKMLKKLINKIDLFFYNFFWSILSIFDKRVCFIITNSMHYSIIKNTIKYLPKYRIYPANKKVESFLKINKINYSKKLWFPKFIALTVFIIGGKKQIVSNKHVHYLLNNNNVSKIQLYHGVLDKNYTFNKVYNDKFDLLLTPGKYSFNKLISSGISKRKIKITGYPKLDSYDNTSKLYFQKKTILYAPTWGAISSLPILLNHIIRLSKKYRVIVKPHIYNEYFYINILRTNKIEVYEGEDITDLFPLADLMISDSSSAMFEFLVTSKPVLVTDTNLWINGSVTNNSLDGPESTLRDIFYRVDDVRGLIPKVNEILSNHFVEKSPVIANRKKVFDLIFEPIKPAGKKTAEEILNFIKRS